MSFPINTAIPATNNNPSVDQPGMQTNYANISGFLSVDHTAPGTSGAGQHNQITFTANQAAPSLGTGVSGIYPNSVLGLLGTISTIFAQTSATNLRLTNLNPATNSSTTNASGATNWSFTTPWGLILQFGTFTLTSTSVASVATFPTPFTTTVFYTNGNLISTTPSGKQVLVSAITTTQISIKSTDSRPIYFIAIGY